MAMLAVRMAADSQVEEVKTRVGNYAEIKLSSQVFFDRFLSDSGKSQAAQERESRTLSGQEASAQRAELLMSEQATDDISRLAYVRTYDKFMTANIDVPGIENTAILPIFESGLAKEAARMGLT